VGARAPAQTNKEGVGGDWCSGADWQPNTRKSPPRKDGPGDLNAPKPIHATQGTD